MLVAFELDDCIDNVLKYLWASQSALFVNMSDKNDWYSTGLGKAEQGCSAFTHLCDAAGLTIDILSGDGLNGVDDYQLWSHFFYLVEDIL